MIIINKTIKLPLGYNLTYKITYQAYNYYFTLILNNRSENLLSHCQKILEKQIKPIDNAKIKKVDKVLTKKEVVVLGHILKGLTNKEIAKMLNNSYGTISTHIDNLRRKLNCRSKGQIIAKYGKIWSMEEIKEDEKENVLPFGKISRKIAKN